MKINLTKEEAGWLNGYLRQQEFCPGEVPIAKSIVLKITAAQNDENAQQATSTEIRKLIQEKTIRLGMTQQELTDLLGEPDAVSLVTRKQKSPLIWKYDGIEFHWILQEDSLWLVIGEAEEPHHHEVLLK